MKATLPKMAVPNTFWRVSIKGVVIDDDGHLLMTQNKEGGWSVPGGGLDHGEQPHETLVREFDEETGLQVIAVEPRPLASWACLDLEYHKGPYPRVIVLYAVQVEGEITHHADDVVDTKWVGLDELDKINWSESFIDKPSQAESFIQIIRDTI